MYWWWWWQYIQLQIRGTGCLVTPHLFWHCSYSHRSHDITEPTGKCTHPTCCLMSQNMCKESPPQDPLYWWWAGLWDKFSLPDILSTANNPNNWSFSICLLVRQKTFHSRDYVWDNPGELCNVPRGTDLPKLGTTMLCGPHRATTLILFCLQRPRMWRGFSHCMKPVTCSVSWTVFLQCINRLTRHGFHFTPSPDLVGGWVAAPSTLPKWGCSDTVVSFRSSLNSLYSGHSFDHQTKETSIFKQFHNLEAKYNLWTHLLVCTIWLSHTHTHTPHKQSQAFLNYLTQTKQAVPSISDQLEARYLSSLSLQSVRRYGGGAKYGSGGGQSLPCFRIRNVILSIIWPCRKIKFPDNWILWKLPMNCYDNVLADLPKKIIPSKEAKNSTWATTGTKRFQNI